MRFRRDDATWIGYEQSSTAPSGATNGGNMLPVAGLLFSRESRSREPVRDTRQPEVRLMPVLVATGHPRKGRRA
jgi:hypothetical protein